MKSINIIISFILLSLIVSCQPLDIKRVTKINTGYVSDVTFSKAEIWGKIIDTGDKINETGHCWNKEGIPTIDDYKVATEGGMDPKADIHSILTNLDPGTTYWVRAYAITDREVVYGKEIEFKTNPTPSNWSIKISNPNPDFTNPDWWPIGNQKQIEWQSNVQDTFIVALYDPSISTKYADIARVASTSQSNSDMQYYTINYTLPNDIDLQAGNEYAISVQSARYNPYDLTKFKATSPSISDVNPPQISSKWNIGRTYTINWISNDINKVNITLNRNGNVILPITEDQFNNNQYIWTIPITINPAAGYTIKIAYTDYPEYFAESQTFEILEQANIIILEPYSSSTVTAGTAFTITWDDNISENVKIDLYQNLNLVKTITDSTESDGSFEGWVPQNSGSNYTIKITSVIDDLVTATSQSFTIN